ncbi:hypothetical protein GIB67_026470 [Kingdonia uniflora]|uniref:Uncharacterized protein n=1 Tax=Kingdonia uniflora TaxID=39325 RepID=A0A7J7P6S6_9MAGN|nr:hypothetical protein GIB67_026470 [Kingdonia uniflora]
MDNAGVSWNLGLCRNLNDWVLDLVASLLEKLSTSHQHPGVNKHTNFQDTRCFFIVSMDGRQEDFSYRKSMENYIKHKYPENAISFTEKYLRKPRPRGDMNNKPRGEGMMEGINNNLPGEATMEGINNNPPGEGTMEGINNNPPDEATMESINNYPPGTMEGINNTPPGEGMNSENIEQ